MLDSGTFVTAHHNAVALLVQGVIGYAQYFTGVPAALVLLHVVGATTLWWAATSLPLSTTTLVASDAHELTRTG